MAAENQHGGAAGEAGPKGTARNAGLRRKLGSTRPPDTGMMTPSKALAMALPKAADEGFSLSAVLRGCEELRRLTPAALLERLSAHAGGKEGGGSGGDGEDGAPSDDGAPDGSEAGARAPLIIALERSDGLCAYALPDPQMLAALIEVQTLGTVLPRPAAPRPPTVTDAAMCAPFIEHVLERFESALECATLPYWAGGYVVGGQVASLRHLEMMLEEIPYRLYALEIDLGNGAKLGRLVFVFPDVSAPVKACQPEGSSWQELFTRRVLESRAELEAVLNRIEMPLCDLRALKVGDVLKMPMNVIGEVALVAPSGRLLARCRLGQKGGQKALRLQAKEDGAAGGAEPPLDGQGFGAEGQMSQAGAMGLDVLAGAEGAGLANSGFAPAGAGAPEAGSAAESGMPDPGSPQAGSQQAGAASLAMQGMDGSGDLPPLEGSPMPSPLSAPLSDLPPPEGMAAGGGELPPPGDMGELPPLGDLPAGAEPG